MSDLHDLFTRANAAPTSATVKELNQHVIAEFRANAGHVGGPFAGQDLLLLHHRGARTGIERVSPLGYLRHQDTVFIVASLGGAPINPAWYHNLKAYPATTIELGAETTAIHATELSADERSAVWPAYTARYPELGHAQTLTTRVFPILRLTPAP
jgi:deazaflavin-dependent oxidoreductase (nitroreductase family)